ncbi:ABC transporter permease [Bacillus sp. AK128]
MLNLIRNEWMKIFKRAGTFVMIGLIVLVLTTAGLIVKNIEEAPAFDENWKQSLQLKNEETKQLIQDLKSSAAPSSQVNSLEREIALNEYRIEHDLSPNQNYSVWGFVKDSSVILQIIGLIVIIVAAGSVASEFNWGTIKLVLIKPIRRSKILMSKYITVISFSLLLIAFSFVYSTILGIILFGMPESDIPYLSYFNGTITEQSMVFHLITYYFYKSIPLLMLGTLAFMMSAVFRNSSLTIGLCIFLLLGGSQITGMIASKYEWAKYLLFANTDLTQYYEGFPMVEGMNITFSVVMLIIYMIIFQGLTHYIFNKRDVAA